MSFRKIQKIDPNIISNPDSGYIYLGQDNTGLWEKDEYGNIWYINSGNTYITIITGSTSSGTSGVGGLSGSSGKDGLLGTAGTSGKSGLSGSYGTSGSSGSSSTSGTSGTSSIGSSGTSSSSGLSGSSGVDGIFYGSSGTSGYSGGYGSATRVWKFTSITTDPPDGRFIGENDTYPLNYSLSLINKIIINTTDLDGQRVDNWLNTWVTGTLKIEDKSDASIFGIYKLESISNTKPAITINLLSGLTMLSSSTDDLINNRDYFISFVSEKFYFGNDIEILRGKHILHRQVIGIDTIGDWRQWGDNSGFYTDFCTSINPTVWTTKQTILSA